MKVFLKSLFQKNSKLQTETSNNPLQGPHHLLQNHLRGCCGGLPDIARLAVAANVVDYHLFGEAVAFLVTLPFSDIIYICMHACYGTVTTATIHCSRYPSNMSAGPSKPPKTSQPFLLRQSAGTAAAGPQLVCLGDPFSTNTFMKAI